MDENMNDELARQLEAAVPADVDLWPKIQERLAQRQPVVAAEPVRKRRWPIAAGAAAAALIVGIALTSAFWPRTVSAQAIIAKAQATMTSPAGHGFQTLTLLERITYLGSEAEVTRWYEAPSRWRVEVRSGGQLQNLMVSNGTDMWTYYPVQKRVTMSEAVDGEWLLSDLSPLGEKAQSLADILEEASRCYTSQVAGSATVAGRATYVIDLKQTGCFSASIPNQGGGAQTLWVDKETYLVLKAESRDGDGALREAREVTRIAFDTPIPGETFSFTAPAGTTVWDARPKPAPAGFEALVAQMQQLAKEADYPLFLPRAVPVGMTAGAPQYTPAGVEIGYSPTGTGPIDAGTVQLMQRKATPSDVAGRLPNAQSIKVGSSPGWFMPGFRNPDGTGLASNLTVVRDGTRISFTSFELGQEPLMTMARSLEQVPGSHAPLPNPVPPTLAELRTRVGYAILLPVQAPAGLTASAPVGGDTPTDPVRVTYVNTQGAIALEVLNGPAGCCLDGDGRKGGQPVTIRSGIAAHFLDGQPQFGGPILWWQEDGAYVALSGPYLTRDDLVNIANSMSATANP